MRKARAKHFLAKGCEEIESDAVDNTGRPLYAANNFEFGNSIIVEREALGEAVAKEMRIPDDDLNQQIREDEAQSPRYRKVILVAQGWGNESKWLKDAVGLDVDAVGIEAIADTIRIHAETWDPKPGLTRMMEEYGCLVRYRHNGANDAVYTLAVLLIGALWRQALAGIQKGDWELMNEVFPLCHIRGEEAIQALKDAVTEEMGGRCTVCERYGHLEDGCEKNVDEDEQESEASTIEQAMKEEGPSWIATAKMLEIHMGGHAVVRLRTSAAPLKEQ